MSIAHDLKSDRSVRLNDGSSPSMDPGESNRVRGKDTKLVGKIIQTLRVSFGKSKRTDIITPPQSSSHYVSVSVTGESPSKLPRRIDVNNSVGLLPPNVNSSSSQMPSNAQTEYITRGRMPDPYQSPTSPSYYQRQDTAGSKLLKVSTDRTKLRGTSPTSSTRYPSPSIYKSDYNPSTPKPIHQPVAVNKPPTRIYATRQPVSPLKNNNPYNNNGTYNNNGGISSISRGVPPNGSNPYYPSPGSTISTTSPDSMIRSVSPSPPVLILRDEYSPVSLDPSPTSPTTFHVGSNGGIGSRVAWPGAAPSPLKTYPNKSSSGLLNGIRSPSPPSPGGDTMGTPRSPKMHSSGSASIPRPAAPPVITSSSREHKPVSAVNKTPKAVTSTKRVVSPSSRSQGDGYHHHHHHHGLKAAVVKQSPSTTYSSSDEVNSPAVHRTPLGATGTEPPLSFGSGSFESHSSSPANRSTNFSWRMARAFVKLRTQPAETFAIGDVPFWKWKLEKIPTLGASPTSSRVQEMFKATLPRVNDDGSDLRVFVKCIPIKIWKQQWDEQDKWDGEFATDGENFVMEAAALAFLHEYAPGIAPRLLAILDNYSGPPPKSGSSSKSSISSRVFSRQPSSSNSNPVVIIISELYGEDLLDYLDRRDRIKKPLTDEERKSLQLGCLLLMRRLHQFGLAHLDFTPENILFGSDGLRLCDFAKATPLWSPKLRHVPLYNNSVNSETLCAFESCEPTIGKGAYMPPECWKIYWRLENERIQKPLNELSHLKEPSQRTPYYFRVSSADVYMAGVVLFWIWSDGNIWKCSDPKQDQKYHHLVKSNLNFDLFTECKSWPSTFKEFLAWALRVEPWRRATLADLVRHPWFAGMLPTSVLKDSTSKSILARPQTTPNNK